MQITLTWQGVITAFGVLGAVIGIVAYFARAVRWVDKQNEQDKKIDDLSQHHEEDMEGVKEELELLVFGVLACLTGLSEQGCDGPVSEAIEKYKKYLNKKAHK